MSEFLSRHSFSLIRNALDLRLWLLGLDVHAVDRVQHLCLFGEKALKRFPALFFIMLAFIDDSHLGKSCLASSPSSTLELCPVRGSLHLSIATVHVESSSSWAALLRLHLQLLRDCRPPFQLLHLQQIYREYGDLRLARGRMHQAGAGPEKSCLASGDCDGHRDKPVPLKNNEIGAVELEGKLLSCFEWAAKSVQKPVKGR
jgi:hypothetical protein